MTREILNLRNKLIRARIIAEQWKGEYMALYREWSDREARYMARIKELESKLANARDALK